MDGWLDFILGANLFVLAKSGSSPSINTFRGQTLGAQSSVSTNYVCAASE